MRGPRLLGLLVASACAAPPASAQLQYFGKNKVQYRDQPWRVLETRHFELHFYAKAGDVIGYDPEADAKRFTVTEGGIAVIPGGRVSYLARSTSPVGRGSYSE